MNQALHVEGGFLGVGPSSSDMHGRDRSALVRLSNTLHKPGNAAVVPREALIPFNYVFILMLHNG